MPRLVITLNWSGVISLSSLNCSIGLLVTLVGRRPTCFLVQIRLFIADRTAICNVHVKGRKLTYSRCIFVWIWTTNENCTNNLSTQQLKNAGIILVLCYRVIYQYLVSVYRKFCAIWIFIASYCYFTVYMCLFYSIFVYFYLLRNLTVLFFFNQSIS